jgi:mRNA-degrading endonuclease toxin of MazEF toxin-antitoxin module
VILDERGNPKVRPALVLSSGEDIATGDPIVVAAISTKFDRKKLPSNWFIMESHPQGHRVTGLDQPCVVKADWLAEIAQDSIERISPGISGKCVRLVLNWLSQQDK